MNHGTLSIVATPIGNLEDITLRALRILKEAEYIACEDTRVTKKLLTHYSIHTPVISYHAHSTGAQTNRVFTLLKEGKRVALVTDAGTPGISDPGLELVAKVRDTYPEVMIEAIPGPSALTAALSISGLHTQPCTFYGFLPQKKGREKLFAAMEADPHASIFYESPHRIMKALESLMRTSPARRIGIFRELTKLHEESMVGTPEQLRALLEAQPEKQRGEFVVVIEAR